MSKKNWIAPEGCSYVIDTEAEASESERKHYGGCVVAESIYHEGDMELILAAPGQADRIAELEATLNVHYKCLDRALQLYLARHPDSISWPDGAQSIVDMVERYEELKLVGRKVLEELGSPADWKDVTVLTHERLRELLKE